MGTDTIEPVRLNDVLIVEDDPVIYRRLHRLLTDVNASPVRDTGAGSLAAAHAAVQAHDFSLALVDVGLPDGSGIDLIAWLHEHRPALPALVISAWRDEETVLAALRAGAIGYLLKERDDAELLMSLKSVQRGGAPIDPAIAKRILAHLAPALPTTPPATAGGLTEREIEILNLVARGYSNREIAGLTGLSRFTVEDHTKRIYRKLAVRSRTAAVHEAKSAGLL